MFPKNSAFHDQFSHYPQRPEDHTHVEIDNPSPPITADAHFASIKQSDLERWWHALDEAAHAHPLDISQERLRDLSDEIHSYLRG